MNKRTFLLLITFMITVGFLGSPSAALAAVTANSVTSTAIVDGAIRTADLANGSVTALKIANGAVNSAKIADRSIRAWDIANGAIGSLKIADGSITNADIATAAINSAKIADGSITNTDIANGAIDSAKIADGSITDADIAPGANIAASKIDRTGLDADRLDGFDSGDFLQAGGDQTITGSLLVDDMSYAAPKTRYVSIPGYTFVAWDSSAQYANFNFELHATGTATEIFGAPVHLPDGAVMTGFQATLVDSHGAYDVEAVLFRRADNGNFDDISTIDSEGTTTPLMQVVAAPIGAGLETIDNANWSYGVRLIFNGNAGNNTRLNRVRVEYTYVSP